MVAVLLFGSLPEAETVVLDAVSQLLFGIGTGTGHVSTAVNQAKAI